MPRTGKAEAMPEREASKGSVRIVSLAAVLLPCLPAVAAEPVSFEKDVQPLLTRHCVVCHLPGDAQGDHVLYPDARKNIVNVPSVQSPLLLVEPGEPEKSYFFLKLTGEHLEAGGSGEIMPFPHGPLAPEEISAVRQWIEQGAGNN